MHRPPTTLYVFSLAVALCLAYGVAALDRSRSINQFHRSQWTSKEGAPSQVVALEQTKDGFLWIGTARGLFRFDGVQFEKYAPPDGIELPSENIYSLKADDDGGLWVSFRPAGVGFIKDGSIEISTRSDELPSSQIYCLGIDGRGRLWGGTHNGLALRSDDGGWTEIGEDWGFSRRRVRAIFTDRQGDMWVAIDGRIVVLRNGKDYFETTEDEADIVTGFAQSPDGRVWKGEALSFVRPVSSVASSGPNFGIRSSRTAGGILFDRDGTLWLTDEDGVKRVREPHNLASDIVSLDDPRLERFSTEDNLAGPILEDREGNIWIGSPQGLSQFRYSYFVANKASARYRNMTLLADRENGIWVGSSLKLPLAHIDGEKIKTFPNAMYISSVSRDAAGIVWWGRNSQLLRQNGDEIDAYAQPDGLKDDWLWEVFPDESQGCLWARAGDSGLISFENGQWGTRTPPPGLPDRGPSASFSENSNVTWLGYTEDRVARIESGRVKMFSTADGLGVGRLRVIRKGADRIWAGGERGLALFDGSRFRTIRISPTARFGTVSGMVFSRDGAAWLNEVQGIVRISKEEVDRVVSDPEHEVTFRRFDYADGLPGAPQMNWTVSTAVESADGRLWFATDGGLASIDPTNLVANDLPPPVAIKALTAGSQLHSTSLPIELPEGTEDLKIEYTALSLSIPERVQFRYMLDGVDAEWYDAQSRREAFYTNLGPGEYRFRVIASNNDGVWNSDGAHLTFRILPKFYQTNLFLVLCTLVAIALIIGIFWWRVEQLKTRMHYQFEERLSERGRIAQNLHDTLLQGFVSASMQLDVAIDSLSDTSSEKRRFERVHEMIKRLVNDGRETVKGLKSTPKTGNEGFGELFSEMREEFDPEHEVEFRVTLGGLHRSLHPIIYGEVRYIAQEAIFNAFRHARASSIEVAIEYSARRLFLSMRDNGVGIDPEIIRRGRDGHWGLTGMRARAQGIGARLKIGSIEGRGTTIELTVPGRVAYQNSNRDWLLGLLRVKTSGSGNERERRG